MTTRADRTTAPHHAWGMYFRGPGRQPLCRLEGASDRRCRLVVVSPDGQEDVVLDVDVEEIARASFLLGQLTLVVRGRKHHVVLVTPATATRAGAAAWGKSALRQAASFGPHAGPMIGGYAHARRAMRRREEQVDPVGLRWMRRFADHGVAVDVPARWKPAARRWALSLAALVTLVVAASTAATLVDAGGWTDTARSVAGGAAVVVALAWALYGAAVGALRLTAARDTDRRLGR